MALGTALKKINARVTQLQKKHPNTKRKTLQKQAGKEYTAGKLKKKRVAKVGAVKVKRRKAPRRRSVKRRRSSKPIVRTRTLTVVKYRTRTVRAKRRSVSRVGKSGKTSKVLLIGGLVVGGLLLMNMLKPRVTAPLVVRTNPSANTAAQNIIAIAQAAGIVGNQLQKIIDSVNSKDDATVVASYNQSGGDPGFLVDYFG